MLVSWFVSNFFLYCFDISSDSFDFLWFSSCPPLFLISYHHCNRAGKIVNSFILRSYEDPYFYFYFYFVIVFIISILLPVSSPLIQEPFVCLAVTSP